MRKSFYLLAFLLFSLPGFSQSRGEWLEYADEAFKNEDYISAAYYYQKVIDPNTAASRDYIYPYDIKTYVKPLVDTTKADSTKQNVDTVKTQKGMLSEIKYAYVVHQIAESYRLGRDYVNAELWYAKAAKNVSKQFPDDQYYYGLTLISNQKYNEALKIFEGITKDSSKLGTPLFTKATKGMGVCLFALDSNSVRQSQQVKLLDTAINSGTTSFALNYYGDNLSVVFTSARADGKVLDPEEQDPRYRSDLYTATKTGTGWQDVQNLDMPINTEMNEGAGCMSINKDLFFFTRWTPGNPNECAIYVSRYMNGRWLPPAKLTINMDGYKTMQPCLSFDGSKLFFSSNRPGGEGKMDIWYCDVDEFGNASGLYNCGPKINTAENEMSPFYHFKTNTLYFSSDGMVGLGGYDIYKSYGEDDNPANVDHIWSTALNMKGPINSSKDDLYFVLQNDGKHGYFSSDRDNCSNCGPTGYCLRIYELEKEPVVFTLSGHVYDKDTRKPIANALLTFKDIDGNLEQFFITTDDSGYYSTPLREELELFIKAQKNKYFGDAATVSTKGQVESKNFVQDFELALIPAGEITIPGIEYDFDKATLRPESKKILDDLADFLTLNNNLTIQINAHTDARGNDAYNLDLSKRRAKSVVDYLVSKGIDPARLQSNGFGETQPLITEAEIKKMTKEEEKEAAHQKNRRTAFVVIKEGEIFMKSTNSK
ncbi:MAG: OmpA family protein [Bacteroidota bacterium]